MAICDPDGPWNYAPRLSLDDLEEFGLPDDFDWSVFQ